MYILEQRGIGYLNDFCPYYYIRKPEVATSPPSESTSRRGSPTPSTVRSRRSPWSRPERLQPFEDARDVKALRIALGFEQWNVWGISYGRSSDRPTSGSIPRAS